MFQAHSSYLSNSGEVVRMPWTGQSFNTQVRFFGMDFTIKCDRVAVNQPQIQNKFILTFNAKFQQGESFYANNFYRLVFWNKNGNDIRQLNLQNNKNNTVQFLLSPENFVEDWCEDIDGRNILTFYLWKTSDPNEEEKISRLTNAVINAENLSFPVNLVDLAKVSEIISNMVSDLKKLKNVTNLSTLFEKFSATHIHMYLCFAHSPNFRFFLLYDIVEVLKICVKLDSKFMMDRIMNMQDLGKILRAQIITDPEKSENPCYFKNLLQFGANHGLYNLVVCCQLADVSVNLGKKNYPTYLQTLGAYYKQV